MENSEHHSTTTFDNQMVAAGRKRDIRIGPNLGSQSNSQASKPVGYSMSTSPTTPKRPEKRVRFSNPGSENELKPASSGLTPSVRRATLSTTPPSSNHQSAPATLRSGGDCSIPISGTIPFESLRQILDGRTKRRQRRDKLSEEANNIEWEKRREVKLLRAEVERLRSELDAKCLELPSAKDKEDLANKGNLGDSTMTEVGLNVSVQELEQQIT